MLAQIICRIRGHRINRRRGKFDQQEFRTRCARCGTAMVRSAKGWRKSAD